MESENCDVEIIFDKTRISPHRGTLTADKLAMDGSIKLRFVQITLQSGQIKYLATNLERDAFNTKEISNLYML